MSKPKNFRASSLQLLKYDICEFILERAQKVLKSTIANRSSIAAELSTLATELQQSNFTLTDKLTDGEVTELRGQKGALPTEQTERTTGK